MERRYAFILALLISFLIGVNYFVFYDVNLVREEVFILRAIDGDTVELEDGRRVRLGNVNAPERGRRGYDEAYVFLADFDNASAELEIDEIDSYGRIIGDLYVDGKYVNLVLVEKGYAHIFLVKEGKKDLFLEAEEKARKLELGIWKRSENYGCLNAEIDKKKEYVILIDKCGLNLEGWSIKDESTRRYVFEKDAGEEFILYSEKGEDLENEFYWGRGKAWNDNKDSIFIRDSNGLLVYYDNYGY